MCTASWRKTASFKRKPFHWTTVQVLRWALLDGLVERVSHVVNFVALRSHVMRPKKRRLTNGSRYKTASISGSRSLNAAKSTRIRTLVINDRAWFYNFFCASVRWWTKIKRHKYNAGEGDAAVTPGAGSLEIALSVLFECSTFTGTTLQPNPRAHSVTLSCVVCCTV